MTTQSEMEKYGYAVIDEYKGIREGVRVRHSGEQWWEAQERGTATVAVVMERDPSSWSQTYRSRDIEILVKKDGDDDLRQWANYHTVLADQIEVSRA